MRSIALFAAILLCLVSAARADDSAPQSADATGATLFTFRHVIIDTSANAPSVCLRFSQKLDPSATAHYGDYLALTPSITPAITATGTDLCLAGLDNATSYKLTIRAGLPAASGDKLATSQKLDIALTDRAPLVAISGDGYILSRNTAKGLVIETVNVAKLKIHVLRMSDKLLPTQLATLALGSQTIDPYSLRNNLQNIVSIAWSGTMDVPADHNRTVSTAFPIASVIPAGRNGLYMVVAENAATAQPDSAYTGVDQPGFNINDFNSTLAAHWVIATDIALTSVNGSDGLHVFARSLASAAPLPGVDIRLLSTGLDTLGKLSTDSNGQAIFPAALTAGTRANAPATIVAYGDGDFAFQSLMNPALDLSDRDVTGRTAPTTNQAFLYTDRGIYRPGETVNLVALLRDRVGNALPNTPIKIVARRPDGVADQSFVLQPAPDGGFTQPIKLSASAAFGNWTFEAYVDPTAPPIGQVMADIEDFIPQQLKVTLTTSQTTLSPTDTLSATINGAFLYGAPAAGLGAQGDLKIIANRTPFPNLPGYSFGLVDDKFDDIDNQLTLDDADPTGKLSVSAALPDLPATSLPLQAVLTAGLLEPSGRYVSQVVTVPISNHDILLGIKPNFADGQAPEGVAPHFTLAAFNAAGHPAAIPAISWTLVEENEIFDWFQDDSKNWTFHYHTQDQQIASGTADIAATPTLFAPSGLTGQYDWGTYRLIISDPKSGAATSVRFNIGYGASAQTATPDKAQIVADKAILQPGDTTTIHVRGPFAGKAQIIVANDRVFSTSIMDIPAGGADFPVTASADWGAGAYVAVTMYRPLTSNQSHVPVRALGLVWLAIDPTQHKLNIAISAPPKILPRETVNVPVTVTGAANGDTPYVTLAAVDEGILQLTNYKTPDPLTYLFGKLAFAVTMRDDYGSLLDGNADIGNIRSGGDSGLGGAELPVTSTKIVSLFSGPVQVGPDGKASIPITVPDFEGQLRLMAIAYNNGQTGSADSDMIVRDPVIADVALPRFLAPGDAATLAISVANTDGAPGLYHLALATTGPATITQPAAFTLAAGQRQQTAVTLTATAAGIVTVNADLTGPSTDIKRSWQIDVRPPHYKLTLQQIALQAPGATYSPDPKLLAKFAPGAVSVSLGYAGYAGIDVPSLLQSLWLYPFGCTEQLTSTAFPLLYYKSAQLGHVGAAADDAWQDTSDAGVHTRVQAAIDTILDRQDDSGTFGLWTVGDNESGAWLNVYTTDFLTRAKAAGYAVPDDALARAYANLTTTVMKIDSGAQNTSFTEHGLEAPAETIAYAEYVLARAGTADISLLRRIHDAAAIYNDADGANVRYAYWSTGARDETTLAEPLALAQLGGALALLGDKPRANSAEQMAVANIGVTDYPSWWFDDAYYSQTRDLAGMISIAADTGNTDLANTLLARLAALHVNPLRLNTQDTAWLLAAAASLGAHDQPVSLTVNNAAEPNLSLPVALSPTPADVTAGYNVTNTSPRGLWRTVTFQGPPANALPALSAGYTLKKTYLNLDGTPLDVAKLRQNDRFLISLSGTVADDDDHRTALIDLLPAGWEIETVIADDSDQYNFLGPLTKTNVAEPRDDRYVAAFDLGTDWGDDAFNNVDDSKPHLDPHQFHVAYLVRVVTPGSFVIPEAVVIDMYRPALMARTMSATTTDAPR